jgi:glycine/D-amino acid oxidase-like deaminating enzyme/heat shock protein HslJ
MKKNNSPWLYQLKKERISKQIDSDIETDVAIVGAGIAGISTAFFVLKYTSNRVVMLERYKLAHGATGHNAGQVVSYFERGFASLVDEFGLDLAGQGQKSVEDAWELLEEMYSDAKLDIPFSKFLGHAGLSSREQVLLHLKNNLLRKKAGLDTEQILVAEDSSFVAQIPKEYSGLYKTAPQAEVLALIETKQKSFIAVVSFKKGCVNSALFCEEVLMFLQKKYSDRFIIYEHTPIEKIVLHRNETILDAVLATVTAKKVILCTNGFQDLTIFNETGLDIDAKFHHLVRGTIGYMSGYLEKDNKPPIAISYLTDPDPSTDDPYFYLTRRKYEYEKNSDMNLISIGGPEVAIDDSRLYSRTNDFPEEMVDSIDSFIKKTYSVDPNKKIDYVFTWHGLMGYTKNGIRLIGPEPKNPLLMYNLGCNGIGILPSIYGGKRIAEYLSQKKVSKSIFDVPTEPMQVSENISTSEKNNKNMNKKTSAYMLGVLVVICLLVGGFFLLNSFIYNEKQGQGPVGDPSQEEAVYPKNISYTVNGQSVQLRNGISEVSIPGSASQVVTRYFGNEVWHDVNGDGLEDLTFLITQQTGGSGLFYYVVSAIRDGESFKGSHATLVGDRISPQRMSAEANGLILVTYADRAPGQDFTVQPSVGKSLLLKFDEGSMMFGEVVRDFEGEANPSMMRLDMKKWTWIRALYNDGTEIIPRRAGVFALTLNKDGTFSATTDCNSVGGNYTTNGSQINFGEIFSTLMYCEDSQESDFIKLLENASGFLFTSRGELVLDLKYDSGTATFR